MGLDFGVIPRSFCMHYLATADGCAKYEGEITQERHPRFKFNASAPAFSNLSFFQQPKVWEKHDHSNLFTHLRMSRCMREGSHLEL